MSPSKKISLTVVIFLAIVIILIVFGILPLLKKIKNNSEELTIQELNLASVRKEIKNYKEISVSYKDYQQDLDKINNLLVDSKNLLDFITFLEKNAADCQLEIDKSLLPQGTPKAGEEKYWQAIFLRITNRGSFPNFLKFLDKLENGTYLIEIMDLNVKRLGEESFGGKSKLSPDDVEVSFSLKAYSR